MTSPTNPIERLDVPAAKLSADMAALAARQKQQREAEAERIWAERDRRVAALQERQRFASRPEPQQPECAHCGNRRGKWVPEPHGARYQSGAQVLVCKDLCTPADPERHAIDPEDPVFAAAAVGFRAPATDADYAEWAARLAAQNQQQPGRVT